MRPLGNDFAITLDSQTLNLGSQTRVSPFIIENAAPSSSLTVNNQGEVGVGGVAPSEIDDSLHIRGRGLLIEEPGNQFEWSIEADDDFFLIGNNDRSPTGEFNYVFGIEPGAPEASLGVDSSGNVTVGTRFPDSSLHVYRDDGTATLKVEEDSNVVANRDLMELANNGGVQFAMDNVNASERWLFTNNAIERLILSHH